MTGYCTTLSNAPFNRPPDVSRGIDGGVLTGLVQSALGPNGLPVVSTTAYAGPSGAITDINPVTRELFFADRHVVQSALKFDSSETLTSVIPVPGALPLLLSGLLLLGWGARRRAAGNAAV